ncbi:hypothetical protein EV127DRAFT_211248 [Xylaria flabelliformis]|nr:hypothetical protein EV127DRAFT_211248 [Xylaria flabelliformis]
MPVNVASPTAPAINPKSRKTSQADYRSTDSSASFRTSCDSSPTDTAASGIGAGLAGWDLGWTFLHNRSDRPLHQVDPPQQASNINMSASPTGLLLFPLRFTTSARALPCQHAAWLPHCAGNSWRGSEIADCYLLLPTQFRIQPRRPRACDFPSAEIMPAATTPIMPERQAFRSIDPKRVSPYKTDLACRDHHTHTPLTPLHGLPWSRPRKARSPNPVIGVRDREDGIGSWPFTYFLLPSINQSIIPSGENARDFGRPFESGLKNMHLNP